MKLKVYEMPALNRNRTLDDIKGIAILMVVLGHTIACSFQNSEYSKLMNVIWTLQMPLFFIVSGYTTKYLKAIDSSKSLLALLKKRSFAYLIPWFVWTYGIKGVICSEKQFFNIKYLAWNMDSGYWFLTSLWMIVVAFLLASYFAQKLSKNPDIQTLIEILLMLLWGGGITFNRSSRGYIYFRN